MLVCSHGRCDVPDVFQVERIEPQVIVNQFEEKSPSDGLRKELGSGQDDDNSKFEEGTNAAPATPRSCSSKLRALRQNAIATEDHIHQHQKDTVEILLSFEPLVIQIANLKRFIHGIAQLLALMPVCLYPFLYPLPVPS